MITTNFKLEKGYISKRLFSTAVAFLDQHSIITKITKVRLSKSYNVYINGELVNKRRLKTRNAGKRIIIKRFISELEREYKN